MGIQSQDALKEQVLQLTQHLGWEVPIDEAVQEALPPGTKTLGAHRFGQSAWSFTARINAVDRDGNNTPFFLKYVPGELGRQQLQGEFAGMTELHKVAPGFVPQPIAWGLLQSVTPKTYFLIVEFKDFTPGLPDPVKLGRNVAAMHKNSTSPTGMFGFPIQTFDGARIQAVGWDPSWTSFFSKLLDEAYRQDKDTNGPWSELDLAYSTIQNHVVPRLIGALEQQEEKIKPVLIHGDMWDGNVGTHSITGDPWVFDCAAYYAHNEMELGIWRAERHQLRTKVYRREYLRNFEPSEPEEEWDDRNRLYSSKTNLMHSACFSGSPARKLAFDDFVYLINKYAPTQGENLSTGSDTEAKQALKE